MIHTTFNDLWKTEALGADQILAHRFGDATMTFGLGPAAGSAKEPSRLESLLGAELDGIRHCRQIHGRTIHHIEGRTRGVREVGDGDGLITTNPRVGLLVWTADCVPVLLAADGVVAAVHSGWRGCAVDIVGAAVHRLTLDFGITPESIHAALGPAVCGGCFEVGVEVPEALRPFGLDEARWLDGNHVDLRAFLTARLEALGVPAEKINTVGGCTVESPDLASFRRDGSAAGRQWSMVHLNP